MAYNKKEIIFNISNIGTRNSIRKSVINQFAKETPGTGTGDLATRYEYVVRLLANGKRIILTRPANRKNGFDFLIRVEGLDFSNGTGNMRDYPKHEEIINDLLLKKRNQPKLYKDLFQYICDTYDCNLIDDKKLTAMTFSRGFSAEMIVHVIKWFFIEQDIRYWNYSGRGMFMKGVPLP